MRRESSSPLRRVNSFSTVQSAGLFRSTVSSALLSGFGIIFGGGLSSFLEAAHCHARFPTIEQVQSAGATLYISSTIADHVDVFISHSWSAGRWGKFFALCLFFNLELAIKCSFAMWSLLATVLVGMFGVAGLGGNACVFPCLVCLPVATFFIVFMFGQDLTGARWSTSLWVDKLCIHQTDLDLKAKQIAALPVFVAHASRMLILWDETYFERLWCNLELATFVHIGGIQNVDLLPLWLAPWLLCSILLDLLSAGLAELLEHLLPNWSMRWMPLIMEATESVLGKNPTMLQFATFFIIWMFSGVPYLLVSVPSCFSFRMKLRSHQLLLDQMSAFDVRAAKCTLVADRRAIEEHVVALFEGGNVPPKEGCGVDDGEVRLQRFSLENQDPLNCFNEHVRGPLCALVESQIGNELHVPFHIALIACLPMIFYSSVNVLACDNGPCETSAVLSGYSSVTQYMVTQVVAWTLTIFLSFPVTSPILLRMINFVVSRGNGPLELFMALLCCPLAYIWSYICGGLIWGSMAALVQYYSITQLLVFVVILAVLVLQLIWLYPQMSGGRAHPSCRCVKRQAYYETAASSPLCPE